MKRYSVIIYLAVIACGIIYNIRDNSKQFSNLEKANIEALSMGESNKKLECMKKYKKSADDNSLAIWMRVCDDCKMYWLDECSEPANCL